MGLFNTSLLDIELVIFEARFFRPLIYIEKKVIAEIAKKIRTRLPNHALDDKNQAVQFMDTIGSVSAAIDLTRVGVNSTYGVSIEDCQNYIKDFTPRALQMLEVDQLSRLGLRVLYIYKMDSKRNALNCLERLVSFPVLEQNGLGEMDGYNITVQYDNDQLKTRISLSPGESKILKFEKGSPPMIERDQVVVRIDIDMFKEKPNDINIDAFLFTVDHHLKHNVFELINNI